MESDYSFCNDAVNHKSNQLNHLYKSRKSENPQLAKLMNNKDLNDDLNSVQRNIQNASR